MDRKTSLSVIQYHRSVAIKFSGFTPNCKIPDGITRGEITSFSRRARQRLLFSARNAHCDWSGMITLCYPADFPRTNAEIKSDLNAFLQRLRYRKIKFIWVLEFQKRGAPHFHIIVDKWLSKDKLNKIWSRIVGDTVYPRVEAIKSPDHAVRYLAGYLSKLVQKSTPNDFDKCGRWWGSSYGLVRVENSLLLDGDSVQELDHIIKPLIKCKKKNSREIRISAARGGRRVPRQWKWRGASFSIDTDNAKNVFLRVKDWRDFYHGENALKWIPPVLVCPMSGYNPYQWSILTDSAFFDGLEHTDIFDGEKWLLTDFSEF